LGVIYLYTNHTSPWTVVYYLAGSFVIISSVDVVRLRVPRFARFYERVLGFLMRESEKQSINGVVWYILGCMFVLSVYPIDIAVVSILILSWCDTTASIFGRLYGPRTPRLPQNLPIPLPSFSKRRPRTLNLPIPFASRKSTAGFLAAAVTGSLIAAGFWGLLAPAGETPPGRESLLLLNESGATTTNGVDLWKAVTNLGVVSIISGFVAGVSEAIDVGSMDDNLTLPIISGGILYVCFKWFGYLVGVTA